MNNPVEGSPARPLSMADFAARIAMGPYLFINKKYLLVKSREVKKDERKKESKEKRDEDELTFGRIFLAISRALSYAFPVSAMCCTIPTCMLLKGERRS